MTTKMPQEGFASTAQVAIYLGISTRTLERMRSNGVGPTPYTLPSSRGRPPVRYKAEEVRQWPQFKQAGPGGIRAWLVEDGKVCGEAARLIGPIDLAEAMLENEDIQAMDLMEALMLPWRAPDDLALYVRETEELAQDMIERARAALSQAQLQASTPR